MLAWSAPIITKERALLQHVALSLGAHLADVQSCESFLNSQGNAYNPGQDGTYAQNYQDTWFEKVARHNGWLSRPGYYLDLGAFRSATPRLRL